MNADQVLDHVRGDLTLHALLAKGGRPAGLTMSSLGVCRAKAGFLLSGADRSDDTDQWSALRGVLLHKALGDVRAELNPGITQEQRVSVTIAGVEVSGAMDEHLDGAVVDYKTRKKAECWARARHGAKPEERMQVSALAKAAGCRQAFVVYIPIDGTWDDWVCVEVDVEAGFAEAEAWLTEVLSEQQENLPRDKADVFCAAYCDFYTRCRGGFTELDVVLTGEDADRVHEFVKAREAKQAAERQFEAAKAEIEYLSGRTPEFKIVRSHVSGTDSRQPYVRTEVRRVS